ncbi:hypothetical protein WJX74_002474 [Apatococcus lobatus]|uniref:Uncharacterized protein n=1 Tax=Apatococcus lobatus TaxID=904363 RepID=A0AAW1R075_9CHLO
MSGVICNTILKYRTSPHQLAKGISDTRSFVSCICHRQRRGPAVKRSPPPSWHRTTTSCLTLPKGYLLKQQHAWPRGRKGQTPQEARNQGQGTGRERLGFQAEAEGRGCSFEGLPGKGWRQRQEVTQQYTGAT